MLGNARACFGVTVPRVYSPAASLDFFGPARELLQLIADGKYDPAFADEGKAALRRADAKR
jgi:hypothetical protein